MNSMESNNHLTRLSADSTKYWQTLLQPFEAALAEGNLTFAASLCQKAQYTNQRNLRIEHCMYKRIGRAFRSRHNVTGSPELSIIIPYNNRENSIAKSIDSLQRQKLSNIEIVAIDDGSLDEGPSIVDKLSKNDSRILHFRCHKPSGNSGSPRNIGIGIARGKFIAFLDSDDYVSSDFLASLAREQSRTCADIVQSASFTKVDKSSTSTINYPILKNLIRVRSLPVDFIGSYVIWDKIYNRVMLDACCALFSPTKIGADTFFINSVFMRLPSIAILKGCPGYYYHAFAPGSVSAQYRKISSVIDEDSPYRQFFEVFKTEKSFQDYKLILWIRRLLSLAYCVKSGDNKQLSSEEVSYLKSTLYDAPIKSIRSVLTKQNRHDWISSIEQLNILL